MSAASSQINWKYIFLTVLVLALIPFPTELIPELRLQVVDAKNRPLTGVNTEQNWKNYTFFWTEGFKEECTDDDGVIIFPRRTLWASAFSRIFFPVLAEFGTLQHGSTGTRFEVRVFDRNYLSDFQLWDERGFFYGFKTDDLPKTIVAKAEYIENAKTCHQ